jgi:hypothetical protein
MFMALEASLEVLEKLVGVEAKVRLRSSSLAQQIADASESIALNLGEGRRRKGGDRPARGCLQSCSARAAHA